MISVLLKYWKRVPFLILYYVFARYLPTSTFPLLGRLGKYCRYFCCKRIFDYCGKNVNVERMALFGSGFKIKIGENSGIGIYCTVPSDIEIGNNVLMGPKCFFLTFNHAFRSKNISIKQQGYQERRKTTIGNDVWIGREVLFTPGRTVADGTVIAARTCVCKDFPAYSIIGGNPSKKIGERE